MRHQVSIRSLVTSLAAGSPARAVRAACVAALFLASAPALANPVCGEVITASVQLTGHLDCSAFPGTALTIKGSGIVFEGNKFSVLSAPGFSAIVGDGSGVTVRNVDVSGTSNPRSESGVMLSGDGNSVTGVTANNRS